MKGQVMAKDISSEYQDTADISSFVKGLKSLGVTSIETSIPQTPSPQNNNVAVFNTILTTKHIDVAICGFSTPDTSGSDKAHKLMEDAAYSSITKAVECLKELQSSVPPASSTPPASSSSEIYDVRPPSSQQRKKKSSHNPNITMSLKQLNYIESLAQNKGMDASTAIRTYAGKDVEDCNNADAHKVISSLKD